MAMRLSAVLRTMGQGRQTNYRLQPNCDSLIVGIIQQDDQTDKLVEFADVIGKFLVNRYDGISTSQIRNIFGEVRKIEMDWKRDPKASWVRLQLLRPKLAYTAKKANKKCGFIFSEILSKAILGIDGEVENFQRFINLFEAILAYHRAYGGR